MGAHPWSYYVPYREDVAEALEELRQQEFAAGRYLKPLGPHLAATTPEEAVAANDATGSRSILDMLGVAESPRNPEWEGLSEYEVSFDSEEDPMFVMLAPLTAEQLTRLFGTDRPTHALIEANNDLYNFLDRGLGLYIVVYDANVPSELFFAGYSFD